MGESSKIMGNSNNKDYLKWGITLFLVILGGLVSYYIIFHIDSLSSTIRGIFAILMPIIDGLILAYLLTPLVNTMERRILKPFFSLIKVDIKKSHRRILSLFITDSVVLVGIYIFFSNVIPQIANSIRTIVEQFPSYVDTLTVWISQLLENNPKIATNVNSIINKYSVDIETFINTTIIPQMNNVIMTISMSVYSILRQFWNFIIGFIISIYLIASKELYAAQAKKIVYAFLPLETANRFISNVRFAHKTFGGFFVGKILDSIIIGIICFVIINFLNMPLSVLISVIIGVTNIIPFFGPFLGAIPSILLILFIDPMQALYFLIFVIILQQVDGNIIGPKILGSSTGLSSFWVIFSITLFGGMFGIFGMIIGVPVFAVIFAFFKSLVEFRLTNRNLHPETNKYLRLLYIDAESKEFIDFPKNAKKPLGHITKILIKNQTHNKHFQDKKINDKKED